MALLMGYVVVAQGDAQDSLLLSKEQKGDKIIERYLIRGAESQSVEFELLFPINSSAVESNFASNAEAIEAMGGFAEQLADTTMRIVAVKVVGYASPDGLESKNKTLAMNRANATAELIRKNCSHKDIMVSGVAYSWQDCVPAVNASSMADKQAVIAILKSTAHTPMQKQAELIKLPKAWSELKNTILPSMRHATVVVDYTTDKVVEKVTVVAQPKPKPQPAPQPAAQPQAQSTPKQTEKPYPVAVVETDETGIIVEVPQKEHRHKRKNR
ncbi:MAG: hypothetical protein IJX65_10000 [Alistipes sp.]|nr:hypothetical protein [Alistipes sp.]